MKFKLTYLLTKKETLKLEALVPHDKSMQEYVSDLIVKHINQNFKKEKRMENLNVIVFDGGDFVICDMCGKDWTNSNVQGGFLFQSKAVCPDCQPKLMINIEKYNEQEFIKSICPKNQSFYDYVMSMRQRN